MNEKLGTPEMGMSCHPDWKCIYPKVTSVKNVTQSRDSSRPRVAAYVHCQLWAMKPKLRTDIFNHKDIMLITLNGPNGKINLVNAYSDSSGSAIRILCNSDIPLLSYLGGDFNCPSRHWDENVIPSNPLTNSLFEFMEEHGLDFRTGSIGATHYPRNGSRPSIIDLVFLPIGDQDSVIHCGDLGESDHRLINTFIRFSILEETLPSQIKKGSEEESGFLSDLVNSISSILVPLGSSEDDVTLVMKLIGDSVFKAWDAHASSPQVCARSKGWWDAICAVAWKNYKSSGSSKQEWIAFRKVAHSAKCKFFNDKIEEISHTKLRPWDLMSWTKPRKQDAVEAILHKGLPCLTTEDT